MAKKAEKRFIKIHTEGGFADNLMQIWVDRQTGVNYLFTAAGYSGGLTVLLDGQGKPVITPPALIPKEP